MTRKATDGKTDGKQANLTLEKKAGTKNGILRLIFVAFAFILEAGFILGLFYTKLGNHSEALLAVSRILAVMLVLGIYSQNKSASIKMPWIVLIMALPAVGVSLYLLIGLSGSTRRMRKRFKEVDEKIFGMLPQKKEVMERLETEHPSCMGLCRYLQGQSGYPLCQNTSIVYFPDASLGLAAQKEAMNAAEKYIFLEYFAIEDRESWLGIEEILEQKAKEGVEVRVFYDDIGSIGYVNMDFAKKLEGKGIHCRVFNPMVPFLNLFLDNRDHRKMTIIDGTIGFTGGYNLANEYFNVTSPYGHWKDTGIRLEGEAVRSMVLTFLEMWNAVSPGDIDDKDFSHYLPDKKDNEAQERALAEGTQAAEGFVQFYADNPMDKKPVGEDVYLSMASRAQKYLYLITPYLILTDEMSRTLGLAAKRGVDVRVITPGIPDKKLVYQLTRSYYNRLAVDGVRIFEYTPGFCHAKMSLSDDVAATCGTINMDYRSLYHHFEDGVLMIGCEKVIGEIKKDFLETMQECQEVTKQYRSGRSAFLKLGQLMLRLFAPLL